MRLADETGADMPPWRLSARPSIRFVYYGFVTLLRGSFSSHAWPVPIEMTKFKITNVTPFIPNGVDNIFNSVKIYEIIFLLGYARLLLEGRGVFFLF